MDDLAIKLTQLIEEMFAAERDQCIYAVKLSGYLTLKEKHMFYSKQHGVLPLIQ